MRYSLSLPFITLAGMSLSACEPHKASTFHIKPAENTVLADELSERTVLRIQSNPASAKKTILRAFDKLAKDGVVSQQLVQDQANIQAAQTRAIILQQLLSLDTNGDSEISAKEMLASNDSQIRSWHKNQAGYMPYSAADLNNDDVISLTESFIFTQTYASSATQNYLPYETQMMAFDENKDGNVTRKEVTTKLESLGARTESKASPQNLSKSKPSLRKPPGIGLWNKNPHLMPVFPLRLRRMHRLSSFRVMRAAGYHP